MTDENSNTECNKIQFETVLEEELVYIKNNREKTCSNDNSQDSDIVDTDKKPL